MCALGKYLLSTCERLVWGGMDCRSWFNLGSILQSMHYDQEVQTLCNHYCKALINIFKLNCVIKLL